MHRALLAASLTLLASPALADAVTYSGTIGKTAIVVEFTAAPAKAKAPYGGRYFYPRQGIDIPLDAVKVSPGKLQLSEELPCTKCEQADDGTVKLVPKGPQWKLTSSPDGKTLTGTWTDTKGAQPVSLSYVGSRPYPAEVDVSPAGLAENTDSYVAGTEELTEETAPYDYLRMQVPNTESAVTTWSGSSFKYLTDPRTQFAFPTIVALAGGADAGPANAYLQSRHYAMNADALSCASTQYAGLGWFPGIEDSNGVADKISEYADESVEVTYLSPTLMTWTESGSLFCGGAHPYNHHEFYNLDVKAGVPLDMSRIFKGWVAKDFDDKLADIADARTHPDDFTWGPDQALADMVRSHLKDPGVDMTDEECGYSDLVQTNLAISFKDPDHVLFALGGLENAIEACGADIYEAPIASLKDYLTPEAADYFLVLKN